MNQQASTRGMPHITLRACAALFGALVLLAGCSIDSKGKFHDVSAPPRPSQAPSPAPKPANCDQGSQGTQRFPDTVDLTGCAWRDTADTVALVGNTAILWRKDGDQVQLRALDANNGGLLWQSAPIELGNEQGGKGNYETFDQRTAYPITLTHGNETYVAVATVLHRQASARNEASVNARLRFYPIDSAGVVQPRLYDSPIGDFRPATDPHDTARDGDQVLLRREGTVDEPAKYVVVDPVTGQGKEFAPRDRFDADAAETPVVATQDGNVVVTFQQMRQAETTDRFGLRSANGGRLWDGKDHAPAGADPLAGSVIGVRGKYLIIKWLAQGTVDVPAQNNTRPSVVSVNDAATGNVIAATKPMDVNSAVDFENAINRTTASNDGRYLSVGRAVFDLKENKALDPLPAAVSSVSAVSPQGIVYGYGNENRLVAYDVTADRSIWEAPNGEGATLLPAAVTDKLAIFQFDDGSRSVVALPVKPADQNGQTGATPSGPSQ